ncbi:MAG TPA: hypothetical protein DCS63_04205 [Elusimicrobia bacterium]|nr:hypothetical protein [Elusimicrobiota bacterium]
MKRTTPITLAAIAVLAVGLEAQEVSFDGLYSALPRPAASGDAAEPRAQHAAQVEREWLVMVFMNGVNDLGILGFSDRNINDMENVGSTDRMAVVVEYGIMGVDGAAGRNLRFQGGSKTIFVTRDADAAKITSPPFYSSTDGDMGSAANLVRFVRRAARRFPARKTAVIIWNHGAGRLGISYDDVAKNHMEVDQLGLALGQIKLALGRKIDVFATDACLMQMAGVAYEFRDAAKIIIGSEETIPGDGFPYGEILGHLSVDPAMDAESLGTLMVAAYGDYYKAGVTLSAIRSSALPGFVHLLNNWVKAVRSAPEAFTAAAAKKTVNATYNFTLRDSKDLYDYLGNVGGLLTGSPAARKATVQLQDYISRTLLVKDTGLPSMGRAHGLAIYIPEMRYNSANYEKLAFSRDSLWDDFLRDMMEERLKP